MLHLQQKEPTKRPKTKTDSWKSSSSQKKQADQKIIMKNTMRTEVNTEEYQRPTLKFFVQCFLKKNIWTKQELGQENQKQSLQGK